jgi:hypothetical protein
VLTHGEQLLAAAEARARSARTRRRLLVLAGPALLATLTSSIALTGAQHARLSTVGPHGFRHLAIHVATIAYTLGFVALPLFGAARTSRAVPAVLALLAGPLITPAVFGVGGWRWWETFVVAAVAAVLSSAALQRRASRAGRAASAAT